MKNKISIIGHLGKDPESRFTPTGQNVTNFSVATTHAYTSKDGEKVKETIWFRVETWGKLAEVCGQWLKKGSLVEVEGRVKPIRIFTKQDGTADAQLEVVAASVLFLGGTKSKDEQPAAQEAETENLPF